jgi:hypothetical protein
MAVAYAGYYLDKCVFYAGCQNTHAISYQQKMVRSVGGIEWLILIYIYYTQIYVTLYNLKCSANLLCPLH